MELRNFVTITGVVFMNKTEKQFKKDFESKIEKADINLIFDTTQLDKNTPKPKRSVWKPIVITASCVVGTAIMVALIAPIASLFIHFDDSVHTYRRRYSINEIKIAESNTFKKLNNVTYPKLETPQKSVLSEEEVEAYNNFSNLTYHSLVNTSKEDNMSYSTIGLYANINESEFASSREDLTNRLNSLLGLTREQRAAFYKKVMLANSYAKDNMTTQLKNSAFFTNKYNYSSDYVSHLTKLYCEAYQIDFNNSKDVNKMVEWVNDAVDSSKFVDSDFFEIDEETALILLSSLYFKNQWASKYISSNNIQKDFHLASGDKVNTTFMKHTYYIDEYYDYDSYISFRDYYSFGGSVTYLIPKSIDDNIYELTKTKNIFQEDEEKKIINYIEWENGEGYQGEIKVYLTTPKFKQKSDINFKKTMFDLGFSDIFNKNIDSFKNAFNDPKLDDYYIYIQTMKQRNEVEFNEDGSMVKSITQTSFGAAMSAAPSPQDTLEVDLNQPFIYIIRDVNDTPIFVGHVDNPTL